jgi:hypothetical protein
MNIHLLSGICLVNISFQFVNLLFWHFIPLRWSFEEYKSWILSICSLWITLLICYLRNLFLTSIFSCFIRYSVIFKLMINSELIFVKSVIYICVVLLLCSILFSNLSLYQYHTVLITVVLWVLKSHSVNSPVLFFFKIVLAILCLL